MRSGREVGKVPNCTIWKPIPCNISGDNSVVYYLLWWTPATIDGVVFRKRLIVVMMMMTMMMVVVVVMMMTMMLTTTMVMMMMMINYNDNDNIHSILSHPKATPKENPLKSSLGLVLLP